MGIDKSDSDNGPNEHITSSIEAIIGYWESIGRINGDPYDLESYLCGLFRSSEKGGLVSKLLMARLKEVKRTLPLSRDINLHGQFPTGRDIMIGGHYLGLVNPSRKVDGDPIVYLGKRRLGFLRGGVAIESPVVCTLEVFWTNQLPLKKDKYYHVKPLDSGIVVATASIDVITDSAP